METKDILKQLRKQSGYTVAEICEKTGIPASVYPKYENGIRNIGVPALCKLATLYHVTTDYILGLEDQPDDTVEPAMRKLISKLESYPLNMQEQILTVLKDLTE